jgi:tRNA threonylcarbamoyladenosine biosynthesis protein TsaE
VNTPLTIRSRSGAETVEAGERLAARFRAGDIALLEGDLAAGKTTFVRGLVAGLGGNPDHVSSPSFVIVQSYDCGARDIERLHHVDLYRLDGAVRELREVGIGDLLSDGSAVTAVEWPKDAVTTWIPDGARLWRVQFAVGGDDSRTIEVLAP